MSLGVAAIGYWFNKSLVALVARVGFRLSSKEQELELELSENCEIERWSRRDSEVSDWCDT